MSVVVARPVSTSGSSPIRCVLAPRPRPAPAGPRPRHRAAPGRRRSGAGPRTVQVQRQRAAEQQHQAAAVRRVAQPGRRYAAVGTQDDLVEHRPGVQQEAEPNAAAGRREQPGKHPRPHQRELLLDGEGPGDVPHRVALQAFGGRQIHHVAGGGRRAAAQDGPISIAAGRQTQRDDGDQRDGQGRGEPHQPTEQKRAVRRERSLGVRALETAVG